VVKRIVVENHCGGTDIILTPILQKEDQEVREKQHDTGKATANHDQHLENMEEIR
jgi:hypothetical protein